MAKVSLRVYNHEIEGLIEAGQIEEAIAHCQHILKTFSMHIATYRLLGKAFLEGRRYADAADIFQRILMSVPDDFVAHVGMSIIRDDENKLDEAIWHMERAFEVQPSNPAIQAELRRLYGRRDGVEPLKIRLSRDALANMYTQGELFNQAIAEIRTVLAEDPNRPDLQVMLARAHFRGGQKVEAAEIAANLLKKYPYCMDALRILVEVLPGSARAENTQVYRQRLRLIDPYSSFVTGSVFQSDQVADSAITLERLEYTPGAAPVLPAPNWADSLGIKLEDTSKQEAAPEWLASGGPAAQPPAPVEATPSAPEPAPGKGEQSIPDWMRSVGWEPSTGEASQAPVESAAVPPAEPNAPTEIPEWLRHLAPPEVTQAASAAGAEAAPPAAPGGASGFSDWLSGMAPKVEGADAGAAGFPPETSAPPPEQETLVPTTPLAKETQPPVAAPDMPSPEEQDVSSTRLQGLTADQAAQEGAPLPVPEGQAGEMPDWLRQRTEPPPAPKATEEPGTSPRKTVHIEAPMSVQEEPAPVQPGPVPPSEGPVLPSQEVPGAELPVEAPSKPVSIEDDTMAWLESLAAKQGARPEELLTKPEERPEAPPDWIQQAAEEQPATPVPPAPPVDQMPAEPSPQALEESSFPEPGPLLAGEDITITSWLNKLDVQDALRKPPTPPAEEQPPVAPAEDLPDWLKGIEKPAAPSEPPKPEEGLPDWLGKPVQSGAPETAIEWPAQPPAPGEEPSTWIDDNALVAKTPAPTVPGEWVPAEEAAASTDQVAAASPEEQPGPSAVAPPAASAEFVPPVVTGNLSKVPVQDKDAVLLANAQAALESSQLNAAMQEYGKLIKKGRLLDEVIHDLREATYRFPVDIIIWQTLGDAHMRANHLQDALDAYTKAEELLR